MDLQILAVCAKCIGMGMAISLGVLGPAIGLGIATKTIIESIARQPESEGKVKIYYFIGIGLIEACAIYALLVAFTIPDIK